MNILELILLDEIFFFLSFFESHIVKETTYMFDTLGY